jgi:hypothetical protein
MDSYKHEVGRFRGTLTAVREWLGSHVFQADYTIFMLYAQARSYNVEYTIFS